MQGVERAETSGHEWRTDEVVLFYGHDIDLRQCRVGKTDIDLRLTIGLAVDLGAQESGRQDDVVGSEQVEVAPDPIAVGDIRALISQLKTRNIGVLVTDHNVRDTLGIVDRAYVLHDGKVMTEGKPDDIVNNPDVRRVYLGEGFSL